MVATLVPDTLARVIELAPRRVAGALIVGATLAACGGDDEASSADVSVVAVAAQPCDRPTRDRGLGVVVGNGLVATAAHTVDGPRRRLTVDDVPAEIVSVDQRTDLALLAADVAGPGAELSLEAPGRATVMTPGSALGVELVRTGRLVVHDATARTRHERQVHTFTPGVAEGTSGAPLVDEDGRLLGIVVLDNRTDGTAYAVAATELAGLLAEERGAAAPVGCPG
jgi:S1-C subfamily serine protease